jgi:hypothetical protein
VQGGVDVAPGLGQVHHQGELVVGGRKWFLP